MFASRLCLKVSEQNLVVLLYNGSISDLESLLRFPPKTVELENVKGGASIKNVDVRV